MRLNLNLNKGVLLLLLIVSTSFTTVLCSPYAVYSNPLPVGTRLIGGKTYYVLPDGEEGKPYSVVFSTDFPDNHKPYTQWRIYGDTPPGMGISPSSMRGPTLTLSGTPRNAQPGTTITYYFTVEARDSYLDGLGTVSKNYMLTIKGSTTPPPPPQKIDYTLEVIGRFPLQIDLTPLALGESTVSKTGYEIRLRKISGDSEMIRLEQSGLPEGVTMWVEGTGIRAPTSLIRENLWLETELTLSLGFTVDATVNWRSLTMPGGVVKAYIITVRGVSQSGVEKSTTLHLGFYYNIPKLQILSLKPLTQHGSKLIAGKQTIFKLEYRLEYNSPMDVEYRLDLGNVNSWKDPSAESAIIGVEYWHYAGLRKEGDPPHWVYYGRATLNPTAAGETGILYLMEEVGQGSGFLPRPSSVGDVQVRVDFDPHRKVTWDEGSITTVSETFRVGIYPIEYDYARRIKVVLWEEDRRFTHDQRSEYLREIATPAYWISTPWGQRPVYRYQIYLSGIFKDYYGTYPVTELYYSGDIGWWNADTAAEEAAEEGFGRVVAIVPNGDIGGNNVGIVYAWPQWASPGAESRPFWDQGFHVAFVEYDEAVNSTHTKNLYFPTVAHELSHTFGMLYDIYDGYAIVVPEECVYFDEFKGGIVKIFKYYEFSANTDIYSALGPFFIRMPNPSYVAARDIMDHAGGAKDGYWAWSSWRIVAGVSGDDPEALLISMIICRNGTVLGRPFQRLYNYSWTYLEPEGTGNFSLTLYLKNGTVFKRYPYNMSFYYFTDPGGYKPTDAIPFVRIVPWLDNLGRIELTGPDGKVWFTRSVSTHAPVLEIVYPPEGKKLGTGRNYTIIWRGTDADGDQLWYTVLIRRRGEETWRMLANRITKDRITLGAPTISEDEFVERVYMDPSSARLGGSEFPEGDYEIQIKATDGVNTAVKIVHVQIVKPEQIKTYTMTVDSNVGLKINGSGTYEEGDMVRVRAPLEEPMKGFLGMLGGKYRFNRWTGAVETKDSEVVVQMTGEQTVLTLTALYDENYTQVFLILSIIIIVVSAIVVLVALKLERKPKPLPPPPPPPS